MRVTFVSLAAYPSLVESGLEFAGGAEFQQIMLGRWLRDQGHAVSFVVADYGQPAVTSVDGIEVYRTFRLGRGIRKLRFPLDMLSLRAAILRSEPEMVNQRSIAFYTGQCCRFASEAGASFSYSLGSDYNCWPDLQGRAVWPITSFYRWGVEHADLVLAQTAVQAKLMRDHFACDPQLSPNMIKVPELRAPEEDQGYVLWVGSLSRLKRPELFVELARELPDQQFVMVGGPGEDEGYDHTIRRRANGVANLDWRGFIPPSQMDAIYRGASMLVGTSRFEGLPNTYLQAWSHGVPVLSVIVDPDGMILEKGLGELVGEDGALAERVAAWMSTPGDRQEAGSRGHEHVRAAHDIHSVAPRIERIFQETLQGRD